MKGKCENIILYSIILLLLIYSSINIYSRYSHKGMNKVSKIEITQIKSNNSSNKIEIKLEYGDFLEGIILKDITDNDLNITKSNRKFKIINITEFLKSYDINLDHLVWITDVKKKIKSNEIDFIFIIVGNIQEKNKKELAKIQKRYNIRIASITKAELSKIFKLPSCKCGFSIILDSNNKIRFARTGIDIETYVKIIKKEIQKTNFEIDNKNY